MSAPTVRGPHDLPDLRVWLREQWADGGTFTRAYAKAKWSKDWPTYSSWERNALSAASLWWVSADMVDLLNAAVTSVPDEVRLDELPKPGHAGFVVFEKPLVGIDAQSGKRTVEVDAITWQGATLPPIARPGSTDGVPCVSVSSYRRLDFDMGLSASELELAVETDAVHHAQWERVEQEHDGLHVDELGESLDVSKWDSDARTREIAGINDDRRIDRTMRLHGSSWAPLGRSDWPLDERLADWSILSPVTGSYSTNMQASAHEDRRLLAALWTLLTQSAIVRTTTTTAERAARRRSERAGIERKLNDITIVTLRRPERTVSDPLDGDEHERRHYSHTFLVSGHWRHQPVGPGRRERRLTWVRPHTKGDGPFQAKQRVNAWVR